MLLGLFVSESLRHCAIRAVRRFESRRNGLMCWKAKKGALINLLAGISQSPVKDWVSLCIHFTDSCKVFCNFRMACSNMMPESRFLGGINELYYNSPTKHRFRLTYCHIHQCALKFLAIWSSHGKQYTMTNAKEMNGAKIVVQSETLRLRSKVRQIMSETCFSERKNTAVSDLPLKHIEEFSLRCKI